MFQITISKNALDILQSWIVDNLQEYYIKPPINQYGDDFVYLFPSKEKFDSMLYSVSNDLGRMAWINFFVDVDAHVKIDRIAYQEVIVYQDFILDLDVYDPESNKSVFEIFASTNTAFETVIDNEDEYIIKVPRQTVSMLATEKDDFMNVLSFYSSGTTYMIQQGYGVYLINLEGNENE